MHRGKEVIGKKIVALTGEAHADHVRDLIFDAAGQRLLGLLVDEGGWFHAARVLPFEQVRSIGENAVMVTGLDAVVSARDVPGLSEVLSGNHKLIGTQLTTTEGEDLGSIADLYFDEHSGQVTGYDVSGGLFSDLSGGRSFVPASADFHLGKDVALVPPEVARQLEEQEPGGLRGVASNASDSIQSATGSVSDTVRGTVGKLVDATREQQKDFVIGKMVASDVARPDGSILVHSGTPVTPQQATEAEQLGLLGSLTAAAGGGALQGLYGSAKDSVQGGYENLSSATKERQQAFVVGKTAGSDVMAQDGFQVVKKGELITEWHATSADTHGALAGLVASAAGGAVQQGAACVQERLSSPEQITVEDVLGRRVRVDVRDSAGALIAPAGQVVTQSGIDRAKLLGKEQDLLAAVQLDAPVTQRLSQTGTQVGSQLSAGVQSVQETSANLLDRARGWLGRTQEQASDTAEERRIEGAVGRPVNRVILDRQDQIILNVGELITHKAVEQARQGDVLGILLSSVSTETPGIDPMSVRPDGHGQAALASQPEPEKPVNP